LKTLFNNFWFSYKNILLREIEKKNYFAFLRKIFGILYKFLAKIIKINISNKIINLDKFINHNLVNEALDEIFIYFNCDKGSYCVWDNKKIKSHNYSPFYEKYLKNFRSSKINILELGSHEGKGIASYFYYFYNSHITGVNINPFQMKFSSRRITELFTDVSSERNLRNLANYLVEDQDIIIDDASHNLRDILISFSILFRKLKKGGVYVMEDMNQFESLQELNPYSNELTPIEILKSIQKKISFQSSFIKQKDKNYLIDNIKDIKIEKGSMTINSINASDIAFIFKK
tara:strand:+ start:658 stop:1521 length:864 start_codon:yes stop_codon:yes gene_type:complete